MSVILQDKLNRKQLERYLSYHCAPVLVGIKSANTININQRIIKEVQDILKNTGVSIYVLYVKDNIAFCYLYRKNLLDQTLNNVQNMKLMKYFGYDSLDIMECLEKLKERYYQYKECSKSFPHEIGLMLDYPAPDVIQFMKRQGKDCRLCGYWKVYCNVERAKCIFDDYDKARMELVDRIIKGERLTRIAKEAS